MCRAGVPKPRLSQVSCTPSSPRTRSSPSSQDRPRPGTCSRGSIAWSSRPLSTDQARTVALTVLLFDSSEGTLKVSNAAGFPCCAFRNGGGTALHLQGFPLGLSDDADYQVLNLRTQPGDLWVMMTDGLVDRVPKAFLAVPRWSTWSPSACGQEVTTRPCSGRSRRGSRGAVSRRPDSDHRGGGLKEPIFGLPAEHRDLLRERFATIHYQRGRVVVPIMLVLCVSFLAVDLFLLADQPALELLWLYLWLDVGFLVFHVGFAVFLFRQPPRLPIAVVTDTWWSPGLVGGLSRHRDPAHRQLLGPDAGCAGGFRPRTVLRRGLAVLITATLAAFLALTTWGPGFSPPGLEGEISLFASSVWRLRYRGPSTSCGEEPRGGPGARGGDTPSSIRPGSTSSARTSWRPWECSRPESPTRSTTR